MNIFEYRMCDPTMGKKFNKDCYEKVLTNHSKYFLRKYHQTKLQSHDIKHMWKHCLQWGKVMNINLNTIFKKYILLKWLSKTIKKNDDMWYMFGVLYRG